MCGRYLIEDEAYADILQILNNLNVAGSAYREGIFSAADVPSATGSPDADVFSAADGAAGNSFVHGGVSSDGLIRGEVFPTNYAPVISSDGIAVLKWGFPNWKNSGVIINARAETALDKKTFSKPLRERRCAVPSSGFYEWSRSGGRHCSDSGRGGDLPHYGDLLGSSESVSGGGSGSGGGRKLKDKYLLRRPGEHVLYMAGFASTFRDAPGIEYNAFVILTTAANDFVSPIHDRMPVILAPDEVDLWSRDDAFMEYALYRSGPELSAELIAPASL